MNYLYLAYIISFIESPALWTGVLNEHVKGGITNTQ